MSSGSHFVNPGLQIVDLLSTSLQANPQLIMHTHNPDLFLKMFMMSHSTNLHGLLVQDFYVMLDAT